LGGQRIFEDGHGKGAKEALQGDVRVAGTLLLNVVFGRKASNMAGLARKKPRR
jgi:hypothetical protein